MNKRLMIGELGRRTGTKLNTIRFYEEVGLLPKPARTASGRRTYGEDDLRRLRFVRHARKLGFGTDMIRSLLELAAHPERRCGDVRELAARHITELEARIRSLKALRAELGQILAACSGDGRVAECGILGALDGALL